MNTLKLRNSIRLIVVGSGVLVTGCNRQPQTVVVENPAPQVIVQQKTKPVPVPQDKTVVVEPAPAPKVSNKTSVTVTAEPVATATPVSAPAVNPTPRSTPRLAAPPPKPRAQSTPRPAPAPALRPRVAVRPTATPKVTSKTAPIVVRAEIIAASKVPDPRKVAYRDSIAFFKYKVLSVQSGSYTGNEILVAHWGMKNKVLQPAARYRIGDVQTLTVEPLDNYSELQSLQRNDDTNEFALDPYWAKSNSTGY